MAVFHELNGADGRKVLVNLELIVAIEVGSFYQADVASTRLTAVAGLGPNEVLSFIVDETPQQIFNARRLG